MRTDMCVYYASWIEPPHRHMYMLEQSQTQEGSMCLHRYCINVVMAWPRFRTAYVVMAYIVMAYVGMAQTGMALPRF